VHGKYSYYNGLENLDKNNPPHLTSMAKGNNAQKKNTKKPKKSAGK